LRKTARVAEILIPLALDQTYSYAVPDGLDLAEGDLVAAPLGPRERIGVVWSLRPGAGDNFKKVSGKLDAPAVPQGLRRLVDWLAWYTLSPKGSALALALKVPTDAARWPGSGCGSPARRPSA
jgi:primosomal protein N' (replication factor Y)